MRKQGLSVIAILVFCFIFTIMFDCGDFFGTAAAIQFRLKVYFDVVRQSITIGNVYGQF